MGDANDNTFLTGVDSEDQVTSGDSNVVASDEQLQPSQQDGGAMPLDELM